jgi:tetratricopeptide (TPR) repeat protein
VQAVVSRALTADPASPVLHEQAALVLGVLGLFDQSVAFGDQRVILGRMAAHLALAQGLRSGEPSAEGRLAGIALLTLAGRKAEAAQVLAGPGRAGDLPSAWRSTMAMLATGDWRPVKAAAEVSLAEALASFQARSSQQGADNAADWLLESGRRDLPMGFIARVTMANTGNSVSLGHQLTRQALTADLTDIHVLLAARGRAASTPADLCAALGAHPGRCWDPGSRTLQVIDWGLWAQHCQAVLLCDMMQTIAFLDHQYGSREATDSYLAWIEGAFGQLEQFPILQKRYANLKPAVYRQAMEKAVRLNQDHPELLSDCSLVCLHWPPPGQSVPASLPRYQDWLDVPEPFGTAYNWSSRTWEMVEKKHLALEDMAGYLAMDPGNLFIARDYLACRYPDGDYRAEGVEVACAGTRAFNRVNYLRKLLVTFPEHAPGVLPLLRELADLDSSWMEPFGRELVRQGRAAEASDVFQAYFKRHPDRVTVSNHMIWEVLYLHGQGQGAKAEAMAEECAEVYSYVGLTTLALLREAQGRYAEAETLYRKVQERYHGDRTQLDAFHCRNAARSPECARAWEERKGQLFPQGMRPFAQPEAPVPPTRGIRFAKQTWYLGRQGLAPDAVIVALDGIQVENQQQYLLVRELKWEDDMTLVVFQGGAYRTLQVAPPRRRFGVDLKDYRS